MTVRVAVTGTPGTGKTTATELVETDLDVLHLNDHVEPEELYESRDEERESWVVDFDAVREFVDDQAAAADRAADDADAGLLVESHLAHHLDADRVVVLRCDPATLERRLRERGEPEAKARENAESEALDVILAEAVDRHGTESVYEVETTDLEPAAVATEIEAVVAGERAPSAGTVNYTGYL